MLDDSLTCKLCGRIFAKDSDPQAIECMIPGCDRYATTMFGEEPKPAGLVLRFSRVKKSPRAG